MMKRRMLKDKKGVLGLEMVGTVIVILLVLAVISIAMFVALDSLTTTSVIPLRTTSVGSPYINETINLTTSGATPSEVANLSSVTMADVQLYNLTSGAEIQSPNFTTSGAVITGAGGSGNIFLNQNVLASSNYTHGVASNAVNLASNVTTGTADFFNNIPTVMTILGAVIIILAVVLIILAVGRIRLGAKEFEEGGEPSI